MKNAMKIAAATILTAGLAITTSCGKNEDAVTTTSFATYEGSSTYALKGTANDFGLEKDFVCNDAVSLIMPLTLNGKDATTVRDSIMMLALNNTACDVDAAIDKWLAAEAKESGFDTEKVNDNVAVFDGFCHVRGYIANMTPDMLVYCVTTDTYNPHAANGMTTNDYINYSMVDNRILALGDLFTAEGLRQLPGLIADQAENIPAYAGLVDISALPGRGDFYLSSEGEIVFSYAPLEVGPHSLGTVEVPFYPYELVSLMTPKAVAIFDLTDIEK